MMILGGSAVEHHVEPEIPMRGVVVGVTFAAVCMLAAVPSMIVGRRNGLPMIEVEPREPYGLVPVTLVVMAVIGVVTALISGLMVVV